MRELLKVALVIGDGVARRSIDQVLDTAEGEWVERADELAPGAREQWTRIHQAMRNLDVQREQGVGMDDEVSYQTLLRSCATMALHSLSVTMRRLEAQGGFRWKKGGSACPLIRSPTPFRNGCEKWGVPASAEF